MKMKKKYPLNKATGYMYIYNLRDKSIFNKSNKINQNQLNLNYRNQN